MGYYFKKIVSVLFPALFLASIFISLVPNSAAAATAIIGDSAPQYIGENSPPTSVINLTLFSNVSSEYLSSITVTVNSVSLFDPTTHLAPLTNDATSGMALYNETNGISGFQANDTVTMNTTSGWSGTTPTWQMTFSGLDSVTMALPVVLPPEPNYYIVIRTSAACVDSSVFNVAIQAGDIITYYGSAPLSDNYSSNITVDAAPPVTNIALTGPQHNGTYAYVTNNTYFNLSAIDNSSGVDSIWFRIWNEINWTSWLQYSIPFSIEGVDGIRYIEYNSTDNIGLTEISKNLTVYLDNSAPTTMLNISAPYHVKNGTTYVTSATQFVLFSSDMGSGVLGSWYRIWRSPSGWDNWTQYFTQFIITGLDGYRYIEYNSADNLSHNESTNNYTVYLDNTMPLTKLNPGNPQYISGTTIYISSASPLTLSINESGSGVNYSWYSVWSAGSWGNLTQYNGSFYLMGADGVRNVRYNSTDNVTNAEFTINYTNSTGNTLYLDNTAPITNLSIGTPNITIGAATYVNASTQFTLMPDDGSGSGVLSTWYRISNSTSIWLDWTQYISPFNISGPDDYYIIEYNSTDNLRQNESVISLTVSVDTTLPITNFAPGDPKYSSGGTIYFTSATPINLLPSDKNGSGALETWYRIWNSSSNWSNWTLYSTPFYITGQDGLRYIEYNSTDNLTQSEYTNNITGYLDNTSPTTNISIDLPKYLFGNITFINSATSINLTSNDGSGSSVASIWYRIWNQSSGWSGLMPYNNSSFNILDADGLHYIEYNGTDNLDLQEIPMNLTIYLDNSAPITSLDEGTPNYSTFGRTFVTSATAINLSSNDGSGSGVSIIWHRIWSSAGSWSGWYNNTAFTLTGLDGMRHVEYFSIDNLGQNDNLNNNTYYLDNAPPSTNLGITGPSFGTDPTLVSKLAAFSLAASDAGSGVSLMEYRIDDGNWSPYSSDFSLSGYGHHNISYRAIDHLGNIEAIGTRWVYLNTPPSITTIPSQTAKTGKAFNYEIIVVDPDMLGSLSFLLVDSPEGMEIDPNTGLIVWIPENDQVGEYTVVVYVTDGVDNVTQEFSLSVLKSGIPAPWLSPELIAIISFVVIASSIGSVVGLTEFGKYGFFLFFLPLYTRLKKEDVLDHFTRGRIYGYIQANPGEHLNAIKRALDLNNGSLVHHLNTLERNGFIFSRIDRSYKRFYPAKTKLPEKNINELTHIQKTIVEVINKNPGVSQKDIASALGISKQLVNYHIKILQDAGCVNMKTDEKQSRCYIPDDFNINN